MSHKGTIITTDLGRSFEVYVGWNVFDRTHGAMYPHMVCDACAVVWSMWTVRDVVEDWAHNCAPRCVHCRRIYEEHADGRCLFGPTKYERIVYEVKYVP